MPVTHPKNSIVTTTSIALGVGTVDLPDPDTSKLPYLSRKGGDETFWRSKLGLELYCSNRQREYSVQNPVLMCPFVLRNNLTAVQDIVCKACHCWTETPVLGPRPIASHTR